MRTLIVTIFVFMALTGYSQVSETTKVRRVEKGQIADSTSAFRRIHLGFTISPDYTFRSLKPDPSDQWMAREKDKIELPKFGFTAGFRLIYKFNKKMGLETGFLYADKGEKTKFLDLLADTAAPGLTRINYHYYYFDIPFKFNYDYLVSEKTTFFMSVGGSTNIYVRQRIISKTDYVDGTSGKTVSKSDPGLSTFNLSVVGGFGLDYALRKSLYIRIEPVFRHALFPILNIYVDEYFYSFGLNVGMFLALGKLRSTKRSFRTTDIQY